MLAGTAWFDKRVFRRYFSGQLNGMWRSLVARFLGVEEAAGSNPVIPIQSVERKGSQLNSTESLSCV